MGKYDNLREKTVFDFCDDQRILKFIAGKEHTNINEYLKDTDEETRVSDLRLLAFLTVNDELDAAVYPLFPYIIEWTVEAFKLRNELLATQ